MRPATGRRRATAGRRSRAAVRSPRASSRLVTFAHATSRTRLNAATINANSGKTVRRAAGASREIPRARRSGPRRCRLGTADAATRRTPPVPASRWRPLANGRRRTVKAGSPGSMDRGREGARHRQRCPEPHQLLTGSPNPRRRDADDLEALTPELDQACRRCRDRRRIGSARRDSESTTTGRSARGGWRRPGSAAGPVQEWPRRTCEEFPVTSRRP